MNSDHALNFDNDLEVASCKCGDWSISYDDPRIDPDASASEARRACINHWQTNHVSLVVGSAFRHAKTRPTTPEEYR